MAIAFVTSGSHYQSTAQTTNTTPIDFSAGGSNTILIAFLQTNGAFSGVSIDWDGQALTQVGSAVKATGDTVWVSAWYLINPDAVNGNLVATMSSTRSTLYGAFYTGALQSSQPNASTGGVEGGNPHAHDIVTTVDDCWTATCDEAPNNGGGPTATTNFTMRDYVAAQEMANGDSNGSVGAAGTKTVSLTWTATPSANYPMFSVAIAPAITATTTHNLPLLGVGT